MKQFSAWWPLGKSWGGTGHQRGRPRVTHLESGPVPSCRGDSDPGGPSFLQLGSVPVVRRFQRPLTSYRSAVTASRIISESIITSTDEAWASGGRRQRRREDVRYDRDDPEACCPRAGVTQPFQDVPQTKHGCDPPSSLILLESLLSLALSSGKVRHDTTGGTTRHVGVVNLKSNCFL